MSYRSSFGRSESEGRIQSYSRLNLARCRVRGRVFLDVRPASELDYFSFCVLSPMLERGSLLWCQNMVSFLFGSCVVIYIPDCATQMVVIAVSIQMLDSLEGKHCKFTVTLITGCTPATVVVLSYVM